MTRTTTSPLFLRFFFIFTILMALAFIAQINLAKAAPSEEPDQYVQIRLIADKTNVQGGDTVLIGIEETIYPHWHTYWKNPGDSGTPLSIKWDLPDGYAVGDLQWPTPEKIPYDTLTNYGYETQVTLLQELTISDTTGDGPIMLNASINLLVCKEICIPETHKTWIALNDNTPADAEKIKAAAQLMPTKKDWATSYYEEKNDFVLSVQSNEIGDLQNATHIRLFPEDWGMMNNGGEATLNTYEGGFTVAQERGERAIAEISQLPVTLAYTNEQGVRKSISLNATPKIMAQTVANTKFSFFLFAQALLFAILGGLILNLMPCVFPILSMKALSLIGMKSKDEKKARGYGLSYTAGILISFGAIAGTLLLLKAGGAQIGWGFQLQNPAIIIFLTYLVFVIGLNLAGLFEFSGRFSNAGQKLTQSNGHRGAFFTGVLATLVATPCTAPFMGAAMGFALTQPAIVSMSVFLALGLGLALPYLALCFIPALRSKLPKPGHWMETFRQILAFPMMITTAWLLWVLSQQINSIGLFYVLLGLITITFVIWLIRKLPAQGKGRIIGKAVIILSALFIATTPIFATKMEKGESEHMTVSENENWEMFSTQKLSALLDGNDPVFTNMTAAWCITCKVNEKVALSTDATRAMFTEQNIQYLKGDWTNQNPEITNYLNSFDRQGVPLYVFYGARDEQTGKRPDPVVLPQILTPGTVKKAILGSS